MTDYTDISELVVLRAGIERAQAHVLRTALASHGIQVHLESDNMGSLGYGVGVDLLVRRVDLASARAILDNVAHIPAGGPFSAEPDFICPHCNSTMVAPYSGRVPGFLPGLSYQVDAHRGWYRCSTCGSAWREGGRRFRNLPFGLVWGLCMGLLVYSLMKLIDFLRWL